MATLDDSYDELVITEIAYDRIIKSQKGIIEGLKNSINELEKNIRQRKGEIAVKFEIGYKSNEELRSNMGKEISRSHDGGITRVTMLNNEGEPNKFYFSRPLGIFIKGEPEKINGKYYCRITKEKL